MIRVGNIINGAFLIFAGVWGYIYLTDAAYIIYLATYIGCVLAVRTANAPNRNSP